MTTTISGQVIREQLTTLLQSHIEHKNAVLDYQPSMITGTPVITVSRRSSDRPKLTVRGTQTKFVMLIEVFVLHAQPTSGWTEDKAEDLIDTIEAEIADVISQHSKNGTYWDWLDYEQPSQVERVDIGGKPYLWETIFVKVEAKGESKTA